MWRCSVLNTVTFLQVRMCLHLCFESAWMPVQITNLLLILKLQINHGNKEPKIQINFYVKIYIPGYVTGDIRLNLALFN